MSKKAKEKVSRRRFLKTTAATAGVTAATIGVPAFLKHASAAPIKWKVQTAWDAGTLGYVKFKEFCEKMNRTKRSAYRTMAKHMKIPMEKAHFGMFNENKCREAIALFDRLMNV